MWFPYPAEVFSRHPSPAPIPCRVQSRSLSAAAATRPFAESSVDLLVRSDWGVVGGCVCLVMFCTARNNPVFVWHITVVNHDWWILRFTLWSLNRTGQCHCSGATAVPGASRNEPGPAQRDHPQDPANLLCEQGCSSLPC